MLMAERPRPAGAKTRRTPGQKMLVLAVGLVVLFVFLGLAAKWFLATVETPTRIEERISR
jgi:hypothetical protein